MEREEIIKNCLECGKKYQNDYLQERMEHKEKYLNNLFEANINWFLSSFFYRFRDDELSFWYSEIANIILRKHFGDSQEEQRQKFASLDWEQIKSLLDKGISDNDFPIIKKHWEANPSFKAEFKPYKPRTLTNEKDVEMLKTALEFIKQYGEKYDFNILKFAKHKIEKQGVHALYYELINEIIQVGDKLATCFLRDFVWVFGLEKNVSEQDYLLFCPVDTWVRQIAQELEITGDDMEIKKGILALCARENLSVIKFNQGIWNYARNYQNNTK